MLAAVLGPLTISDLVIIAVLLLFAIFGIKKGLFAQIISLVIFVVAVLVARMFCGQVKDLVVANTDWVEKISTIITENLNLESLNKTFEEAGGAIENLKEQIATLNLPQFLVDAILTYAEKIPTDLSLTDTVSVTIANYVILGGSYVALFLITFLLGLVAKILLKVVINHTPLKIVDRLLGLLIGLIKGIIIASLAIFVINMINVSGIEAVKQDISESLIANFVAEKNIFQWLLSFIPFV